MEDNNNTNVNQESSANLESATYKIPSNELNEVQSTPMSDSDSNNDSISNDDSKYHAVNLTKPENNSILELYQFYKSKPKEVETPTFISAKTVALFVSIMVLCLASFISCIVIDMQNPTDYIADTSSTQDDTQSDDTLNTDYDFTPNNGINIEQYNPPERQDSTYMNEDGTYTVAGVAKYASDSIIAIYVSTDGMNLNGMGSGIVFSKEGYVLTNAHVIEDANYIIGILPDETKINLSFVGMNSELDIAVLQSDNKDIPVATMGNSDSVILGEDVVAIGNPAGLTGTVTKGIVSSINRLYKTSDDVERTYIQTDTAISPGNSGGALLNMYGQVIGITTLKISQDQTYEGLGFAICINDALKCAKDLIKNRFRIGITFNLESNEIEITEIDKSCSVSSTDLQVGDIITEINGQNVYDYSTVMSALEGSKPGDEVTAKVERRSKDGLKNEFYIEFNLMPYGS